MSAGLLLVSKDAATLQAVQTALNGDGPLLPRDLFSELRSLGPRLESEGSTIVVVDLDPEPAAAFAELDRLISRYHDVRFIGVSAQPREALLVEAMHIGLRHLIAKSTLDAELPPALHRLKQTRQRAAAAGAVVTVLAAGGGCGATTLAVNLAHELHLTRGGEALLADLDLAYGSVASYLGVKGQFGVADVLARKGSVDGDLVRTTACQSRDKLSVLLSPVSTNPLQPMPVNLGRLDELAEACRQSFQSTVFDAPRLPLDATTALVQASDQALIVFQLNVKDVQVARSLMTAMTHRGVPAEKLVPIANRYKGRRQMVGLEEAEQALHCEAITPVRNDYRSAVYGINFGRPLEQAAPRSRLRKDLSRLAGTLLPVRTEATLT